jgi:alkylation response protein AidB-like acyl-CoA dehydrogenase
MDHGRPLATLAFDGAVAETLAGDATQLVDAGCVLLGDATQLVDAGCVLLAADSFGAAHQLVRATAEYAKTRQQFGQPIAQFQAVKHQLANMALAVDPERGLWWYAAHAFDHAPADASRAAALAKAHVTDRAQDVVRSAVEAHGGIGFTWVRGGPRPAPAARPGGCARPTAGRARPPVESVVVHQVDDRLRALLHEELAHDRHVLPPVGFGLGGAARLDQLDQPLL